MPRGLRQVEHDDRELTVVENDFGAFTIYYGRHDISRFQVSRALAWHMAWFIVRRCVVMAIRGMLRRGPKL